MKKIIVTSVIIVLVTLVLLGCAGNRLPRKEREFVELVQISGDDLNQFVQLNLAQNGNSLKFGDPILIDLENKTYDDLTFPFDYGVSLYIYDEANKYWLEIDNLTVYSHMGDRTISPIGKDSDGKVTFSVFPDTQGLTQPVVIRLLVRGEKPQAGEATNAPSESVPMGAYLDITLSP